MSPDMRRAILAGFVLGVTAGVVVWFLERFELNRLHAEVGDYLGNYDKFQEWLRDHGSQGT